MGNCNFTTDNYDLSVSMPAYITPLSCQQVALPVSLCDWARWFRKGRSTLLHLFNSLCSPRAGVESREEENGAVLCDEGDVQVAYYNEALRQLCDERAKAPRPAEAPVRAFLLLNRLTCAFSRFLVNMAYAFQDRENLYLVTDLLGGGDLRFHIGKKRKFSEEETSMHKFTQPINASEFMVACIIVGLEYMHSNGVLHRDIKPENLVIDERGYVRVTDLGIARIWTPENSQETSGTPGYMAPEVMCRQNHTIAVDYFAVGVIGFEFMMGKVSARD